MKRTDIERRERELRRAQKKDDIIAEKTAARSDQSVGGYITSLYDLLRFDEERIYNILNDEDILELLLNMKDALPQKQWEPVFRKAIRKSKVKQKQEAYDQLMSVME